MTVFERIFLTFALAIIVTGIVLLVFIDNNRVRKILGRIFVTMLIALVITLFTFIWIV